MNIVKDQENILDFFMDVNEVSQLVMRKYLRDEEETFDLYEEDQKCKMF